MRNIVEIEINGQIADVDTDTAIGFNFQTFNPSEPENLFLSFSNTFSLPMTARNRSIFHFVDNVCYNGTEIYDKYEASAYVNGFQIMHGMVYVDSVTERINIAVYDKLDFIDELKNLKFADATGETATVQGLLVEHVNGNNTFLSYESLVQWIASGTNDIWLPYSLGGLAETMLVKDEQNRLTRSTTNAMIVNGRLQELSQLQPNYTNKYGEAGAVYQYGKLGQTMELKSWDDDKNICLALYFSMQDARGYGRTNNPPTNPTSKGIKTGHLCAKVTTLVDLIFDHIGVESNLSTLLASENLFMRVPDVTPLSVYSSGYLISLFVKCFRGGYSIDTFEEGERMDNVSAWDFIKALMLEYNLVIDRSYNISTGKQVYTFHRFNDIKLADKVGFQLVEIIDKSFKVDGVKQKSVIAYDKTGGEGDSDTSAGLLIECDNRNIEEGSDTDVFFKIGRYLPSYYAVLSDNQQTNYLDIDLSEKDAMKSVIFLTPDTTQYAECDVWTLYEYSFVIQHGHLVATKTYIENGYRYVSLRAWNVPLFVAKQPAVCANGAYEQYKKMVKQPLVYKVRVLADLMNAMQHRNYLRCSVDGIVGDFYIASIENYNPMTDDYFTMTIYRLEREIAAGETIDYLLATETQGGAYVITEANENNKFITKED